MKVTAKGLFRVINWYNFWSMLIWSRKYTLKTLYLAVLLSFFSCQLCLTVWKSNKHHNQTQTIPPAPILIQFELGYVPTGVFCGLITKIATEGKAKILGESWKLKNDQVKRITKVSFLLGGLHVITLISHSTCYEIRIERKGTSISLVNLCSQVLPSILFILKDLYERLDPINYCVSLSMWQSGTWSSSQSHLHSRRSGHLHVRGTRRTLWSWITKGTQSMDWRGL